MEGTKEWKTNPIDKFSLYIEGIGATEGVDWRAGPVKGAAMGFKNFIIKKPLDYD